MPLYEYECAEDGTVIEVIRPMSEADAPLVDPAGKGRKFRRRLSVFAAGGGVSQAGASGGGHVHSGTCGCGKTRSQGGCGA
ncbi:MAG: FmdB family zinc ribbon protein [Phycisphaerales bacterium]